MAQKRSSSSNTKRKTSASRPKSSSNAGKQKQAQPVPQVTFKDLFHRFSKTRFFRPLLIFVITVLIIGLDLLISWNSYNVFFMLVGIELLIGLIIWIVMLLKSASASPENQEPEQ